MPYAELHCISNFTFLRGASRPEELVTQAAELDYSALAITDECSLAGVVKAHVAAKNCGIKLIIGSEFALQDGSRIVALAPNRSAYAQLSGFITLARRRADKGAYQVQLRDFELSLPDCLGIWLPPTAPNPATTLVTTLATTSATTAPATGSALKDYFPAGLWLGVECFYQDQQQHYLDCYALARQLQLDMVACGDVHMHHPDRKPLQDALTAIRLNTAIDQLGSHSQSNRERYLRPIRKLQRIYPRALLEESVHVSQLCSFSLDELRYQYPHEVIPPQFTAPQYLRQLAEQGARQRWPEGISDEIRRQLESELELIRELRYEYYFLTVYDLVAFARSEGILCQGRGSAANSVVCYCLFITEVNPQQASLLFERFISRERNEPPDIDVDFEHERREEVIQYIYKKYSRERAALAATVITYRARSAVRDIGKALGLDPLFVDQLSKSLAWWDRKNDLLKRFRDANLGDGRIAELFMFLINEILGFPRHLSQHVGGFIICDRPVSELVPVENASMAERTVIQWDKEDIEALGLLKVDVLALGMLSAIRKCLALANQYCDPPLSLANIPREDPHTYRMLSRADSVGVFQVESRAQMSMLPRLKPECFYDLVIQVAIVRPGPIQGDMVHPYLQRRAGEEPVHYENDEIKSVLERTLGVPIFQEQVIKLAMVAAGFSGGEADQLRRAMASWGKNGNLLRFRQKLIDGMLARGHSEDFAERVFNQMKGFGSYGFPESHAASFALLVYLSAWLKCHHPAAFYSAIINSQPMGFYSPSQLVQDARRHDIVVRPVDIDHSHWDCTLEDCAAMPERQPVIRLGMRLVKGFNERAAERLVLARQQRPFRNLQDLCQRARLNQLERTALVRANTLIRLSKHRHQAHWQNQAIEEARPLLEYQVRADSRQLNDDIQLPAPSEAEDLCADYNSTGLTLNRHPMAILRDQYPFNQCRTAQALPALNHGRLVRVAGIVTGRQRPVTASGVIFLTLEDETGNLNVIVWKTLQDRYRQALLTGKLLLIKGIMERKDSVIHIVAGQIIDHSQAIEGMLLPSRDFH